MKKIFIVLFFAFVVLGCARGNRYLPPEGEKISSVSDTSKCTFIKNEYCETRPSTMIHYVQLNTYNAGGDSYKIIATSNQIISGMNVMMINFEIYKCKP
ncbi:MAG: hypothetical protein CVU54_02075 [Deltaproteobacteria bacterium HGW-Deltaproteobacteria-12]|jgi:hypothetical protein|nr:MAG: hypothetical protein CVU54_02075 [Deltaproteobacteria bacterium HGW-Deltaproteobacteria-12]